MGLPAPNDASLRNLVVPEVVFANDLVLLRVQCQAIGYDNRSATLVAKLDGDEVARRAVSLTGQRYDAIAKVQKAQFEELSDSSQPMPLIVWHRYGAGKVMFIGTDQLWRLRARTGDKYHLKFWGQAIQFLTLSRLLGENRLVQFQTGRERYALGEPVEVFATATNDIYEPLTGPTFAVKVTDVDGGVEQSLTLKAVPGMSGLYHGFHAPRQAGRFRVVADEDTGSDGLALTSVSSGAGGGGAPLDVQFEVLDETSEQAQTAMQRALLVQMAAVTGGQYLPLRDLSLLPKLVPEATSTTIFTREFELWDHWLFALIFVGLVAVEWAWRRHSNLA